MSKKKKIRLIVFLIFITSILLYPYFITIGHMEGAENDRVVLERDGAKEVYVICEHGHKQSERGRILGKIDGLYDFVFEIDNKEYPDCIYVAGMGRGEYYTIEK